MIKTALFSISIPDNQEYITDTFNTGSWNVDLTCSSYIDSYGKRVCRSMSCVSFHGNFDVTAKIRRESRCQPADTIPGGRQATARNTMCFTYNSIPNEKTLTIISLMVCNGMKLSEQLLGNKRQYNDA